MKTVSIHPELATIDALTSAVQNAYKRQRKEMTLGAKESDTLHTAMLLLLLLPCGELWSTRLPMGLPM
jgi:hypothetical protein